MNSAIMYSPLGELGLFEKGGFLKQISFITPENTQSFELCNKASDHPLLQETIKQLDQYFKGQRTSFDLPLQPEGTAFRQKCWNHLLTIVYGETISYEQEAIAVGGKQYSRAVGGANGSNPIPIIIPCHRVIAKNGSLGGYASGLEVKQWLLDLESSS